jgi:prophage maintenance system killer protein
MKKFQDQHPVIYQASNGAIELRGDVQHETLWATLDQIADVFGRDKSVISRHLKNIFVEKELNKDSVVAKTATTASDGKIYQVEYYNLDAIISVGYRVNSKTATMFRQWATKTLREYITYGFVLNKKRISKNYQSFLQAIEKVRILIPEKSSFQAGDALSLVTLFADTWFSLNAYDTEKFSTKTTKRKISVTTQELIGDVVVLKRELLKKLEAGEVFAVERSKGGLESIFGNVMQSFGGEDVYPSLSEKAAHILYFIVKNHPFIDGNKRVGAFSFVWFLQKAKALNIHTLTPHALTALTLLIAESSPKDKDKMIGLVRMLLEL